MWKCHTLVSLRPVSLFKVSTCWFLLLSKKGEILWFCNDRPDGHQPNIPPAPPHIMAPLHLDRARQLLLDMGCGQNWHLTFLEKKSVKDSMCDFPAIPLPTMEDEKMPCSDKALAGHGISVSLDSWMKPILSCIEHTDWLKHRLSLC